MTVPVSSCTSISFVIPHMGREEMLIQTLQSIAALDVEDVQVSVIVSTKNKHISKQLFALKGSLKIEFLMLPTSLTISEQRNQGVKKSDSQFLAFIDADIALSKNWVMSMLAEIQKTDIVLCSAMQKPSEHASNLENVRVSLSNVDIDCEMQFLPGRNLFLSREVFEQSGGFPDELVTCEDYVFTQRVAKLGKLFYTSSASYVHIGEDKEYLAMAKKEIWRGQSNLASLKGRDIPLSEYPSFFIPPVYTLSFITIFISLAFELTTPLILSLFVTITLLLLYTLRLQIRAKQKPSFLGTLAFYGVYFPARALGTALGAVKTLHASDYKQ